MMKTINAGFIKILSVAAIVVASLLAITCDDTGTDDKNQQLLTLALLPGCTSSTTSTKLVLYNADKHNGDLKGVTADARTGADAICNASENKPIGTTNVHAFISISTSDQIKNLPANFCYHKNQSMYGPDGTSLIADNWADLMDGSINMSLFTAGVLPDATWMSGSTSNGALSQDNNCSGFTTEGGLTNRQLGDADQFNSSWITGITTGCDVPEYYLLCIGEQ